MTTAVELYRYGTSFATRQLATSIAEEVLGADEITIDFSGVVTAAPAFVDQLVGDLSERARRVSITGLTPENEELVGRVVERRGLSTRFVIAAPADHETKASLPEQERVYRAPARFGHVPISATPLGWDSRNPGFRNHYPHVRLPTQVVERVRLDDRATDEEPNRLVWGDNLHALRTLPSESVDLIYIDPPFFSNRTYNVIWGDEHEERSFSDIWEGGLDGYLIWLNARLYEMKRLLKPTGSIYVHCDWHASHYIKVEMDKIFGYENFRNEIVWSYSGWNKLLKRNLERRHDILFFYGLSSETTFSYPTRPWASKEEYVKTRKQKIRVDDDGREYVLSDAGGGRRVKRYLEDALSYGVPLDDVWPIGKINNSDKSERIGYPTQKPEALIERVIRASTNEGDVVLDAFVGGGTTPVVAQRLGRRWIAMDQSRVAIAVTSERLKHAALERGLDDMPLPEFTIEHWGVYEAERLSTLPAEAFRAFILDCYDARVPSADEGIHGYKGAAARVPVWIGSPELTSTVTAADVDAFAQAIARLDRYRGEEGLRDGVMLAWGFRPDARRAADELREREGASLAFVRLQQVTIDSPAFRRHVATQSTDRGDYTGFLTFVQPPLVRVAHRRLKPLRYEFDASDTQVQNAGAQLVNVQWDFDYDGSTFRAARGEWFHRRKKGGAAVLDAQHAFPRPGQFRVACRVQDDKGGEGDWSGLVEVA